MKQYLAEALKTLVKNSIKQYLAEALKTLVKNSIKQYLTDALKTLVKNSMKTVPDRLSEHILLWTEYAPAPYICHMIHLSSGSSD